MDISTKLCPDCSQQLPVTNFTKAAKSKDGLDPYCRTCKKVRNQARRGRGYNNRTPEQAAANFKKWYDKQRRGKGPKAMFIGPLPNARTTRRARYLKDPQKQISYSAARVRHKYKTDPLYRLMHNCRTRISHAIRGSLKESTTRELLGCTPSELRQHLESQFEPGMTWENRKEWHVDHRIGFAMVDVSDPEQLKAVCHYTNLRPLWAKDNSSRPKYRLEA